MSEVYAVLHSIARAAMIAGGSVSKSGGFVQGALEILVFDWKTGKVKKTIKGSADTEGYVFDMVVHPDGFLMAVSSGQPGQGKLFFQKLDEAQPFFALPLPNCHSLSLHPNRMRLVVSATNGNSSGNGRPLGKNKEYPGNDSPLHIFDLPKPNHTGQGGNATASSSPGSARSCSSRSVPGPVRRDRSSELGR